MLDDDPVCRPGVCTDLRVRPEFAAPFAKATASNSQTATAISIGEAATSFTTTSTPYTILLQ